MAKLVFKTCSVCGSEPVILKEGDGDTNFYIARCPNFDCTLYNEDTYDNLQACCDSWNARVAEYAADTEDGGDEE